MTSHKNNTINIDASKHKLAREELAWLNANVSRTAPGDYTLPELIGAAWGGIHRPRAFGKWFRASVAAGDVPGVRWVRKRSDRRHLYEVLPRTS